MTLHREMRSLRLLPVVIMLSVIAMWLLLAGFQHAVLSVGACIPSNSFELWPYWRNNRSPDVFARLKENQCARWGSNGFEQDYCLGSRLNVCLKTCAADTDCLVPNDITNVDAPNTYKQQYCRFHYDDGANIPIVRYQGVGDETFYTGPASMVCQCRSDGDCKQSERCYQGACMCTNSQQCGAGRQCSWYGRSFNEFRNSVYKPYRADGQCRCNPAQGRVGCSGRGHCTQQSNFNSCSKCVNQMTFDIPSGGPTSQGYCHCLSGFTGNFCETDDAVNTKCSGHGKPLCKARWAKDANTIERSLNTGAEIKFDAATALYSCDISKLQYPAESSPDARGDLGCQCAPGWGPETANPGTPKCSRKIDCQTLAGNGKLVGFLAGDGKCKCLNDFYDSTRQVEGATSSAAGYCLPDCRANRCSGHGTCIPNPNTGDQYNSQCACDLGWQTSKKSNEFNVASDNRAFEEKTFCDVPVDPNYKPDGAACGFWAAEQIAVGSANWCTLKPTFQATMSSVLAPDASIKLFVQSCGRSANPLFLDKECGGSTRGTCVSDNRYGSVCQCKNGYKGLACDDLVCPRDVYVNGGVCSGLGFCDNPTLSLGGAFDQSKGTCICQPGFGGFACEIRKLDCGSSQTVRNYPLVHNITAIV